METTTEQQPDPQRDAASQRPPHPGADRLLKVPGVRNLRDAGGFGTADGGRVASGLLYRSGSLHELGPDGAARLAALRLRTVVDLRSTEEIEYWPNRLHDLQVDTALLPVLPPLEQTLGDPDVVAEESDDGMPGLYGFMAETAGPPIVAFIRRITAPEALPALVHCAVGKDRTGVTIAVVLSVLGVDPADIITDYTLSNEGVGLLDGPVYYLDQNGEEHLSHAVYEELILLFLDRVRTRHGSVEEFLYFHGLRRDELDALRRALLSTGG